MSSRKPRHRNRNRQNNRQPNDVLSVQTLPTFPQPLPSIPSSTEMRVLWHLSETSRFPLLMNKRAYTQLRMTCRAFYNLKPVPERHYKHTSCAVCNRRMRVHVRMLKCGCYAHIDCYYNMPGTGSHWDVCLSPRCMCPKNTPLITCPAKKCNQARLANQSLANYPNLIMYLQFPNDH